MKIIHLLRLTTRVSYNEYTEKPENLLTIDFRFIFMI